jgi:hypothetical protein
MSDLFRHLCTKICIFVFVFLWNILVSRIIKNVLINKNIVNDSRAKTK